MGKLVDMTGQRFGRLVVLHRGAKAKHGCTVKWLCKCDCGNLCWVDGPELRKGDTRSCGCLKIESGKSKKGRFRNGFNYHEIKGEICYIYNDDKTDYCVIDSEDIPLVNMYHWRKSNSGYWTAYARYDDKNTTVQLHKIITNTTKDQKVDHKNRKRYDCRKSNLRKCTDTQNSQNITPGKLNKTGVIGVAKMSENKYAAYITVNKKRRHLGFFKDMDSAVIARLKAEDRYFKDFAPQRHLFEQYGITEESE